MSRPGQAVIEVLIGVGISVVALLALIQVATKSVSNSGFAKRQSVATAFAIEGMEWVKGQRRAVTWDNYYDNGSGAGRTYCLNNLPGGWDAWVQAGCGTATISGTEYTREVILTSGLVGGNEQLRAVIEVRWNESGRTARSLQETYFFRY